MKMGHFIEALFDFSLAIRLETENKEKDDKKFEAGTQEQRDAKET